jgi:hypothetical protein
VDRAFVPGELVLQVRGSLSSQELERILRARGLSVLQNDDEAGVYLVSVPAGSEKATAAVLKGQRGVLYADKNYVVSAVR